MVSCQRKHAKHHKANMPFLYQVRRGERGATCPSSDQDTEMKVENAMAMLNVAVAASNHHALSICDPKGTFAQIPWVFSLVNRIHILSQAPIEHSPDRSR